MSHGFIALLDILVVALDRIVVVLEAVLLAGNGNTVHELGYAVEVPVEDCPVLPELVAHEGHEPPFLGRFVLLLPENLVYLLSDAVFQLPKEPVELLKGSVPHEPAPKVVLSPAVDGVYTPDLFFPTFSSTSSRCIRPLTFGFGMRLRSNRFTSFEYVLTQSRIVESAGL